MLTAEEKWWMYIEIICSDSTQPLSPLQHQYTGALYVCWIYYHTISSLLVEVVLVRMEEEEGDQGGWKGGR